MGCSFSRSNALYGTVKVGDGGDVWINDTRFRIVRQLGEGDFAFVVYLVKELVAEDDVRIDRKKSIHPAHFSDDGTYAMQKLIIQSERDLKRVSEEIRVTYLFRHPNLLPLIDHAIIPVKGTEDGSNNHEAYLLFPFHNGRTLFAVSTVMRSKKEFFLTIIVLQIFQQLCAGLKHIHSFDPPYAHTDVRPGNVLIIHRKDEPPLAILMNFFSASPSRKEIRSRSEALQVQEWARQHGSAPFQAPELRDCPSHADIDESVDIWSLGCTLYAIMYGGVSPFEDALSKPGSSLSGVSLQSAVVNAQIKWPSGPNPPYPEPLHQFVVWMLERQPAIRPNIDDVIFHVEQLISTYSS